VPILTRETYTQAAEYSCWACCARYVNNYYAARFHGRNVIASDAAVAEILHQPLDGPADVHVVLETLGLSDSRDSEYIPQLREIQAEIDAGRPLVVCISPERHGYLSNEPIVGGHYVVIVGYEGNDIIIMDPGQDYHDIYRQTYHQTTYNQYEPAWFWCGTEYTRR
jgi:hypothetical protein